LETLSQLEAHDIACREQAANNVTSILSPVLKERDTANSPWGGSGLDQSALVLKRQLESY